MARNGNIQAREQKPTVPINEMIKFPMVRLLKPKDDETGEDFMAGIVSIEEALEEASILEMDLVLINDKSDPPICKIVDYGKFRYLQEKRKKEQIKKQTKVEIKEVKLSCNIDEHDLDVRRRSAHKFLSEGDRVSSLFLLCNNNINNNHFILL
jgi:translation initiation factor IF-3